MKKNIFMILLALSPLAHTQAGMVEIANDTVLADSEGREIKAQGGSIIRNGNTFYWYGVETDPDASGKPVNKGVRCYSSTDFSHWRQEGLVFSNNTTLRVQALFNASTRQYVLFLKENKNSVRVAFASQPAGPFEEKEPISIPETGRASACSIFQDDDGKAYLVYAVGRSPEDKKREIKAVELSANYAKCSGNPFRLFVADSDEPYIWKRNGSYYCALATNMGWVTYFPVTYTAPAMNGPWGNNSRWGGAQIMFDTNMSFKDSVTEIRGTEGSVFVYCGSRYPQYSELGVGRNVFLPLAIKDPEQKATLDWHQKWLLDVEKGVWAKSK